MLDLDERLDELRQTGRYRRLRMVSGPQGPRVVLDGRPVMLLCSGNALGLADHPRVREAAADAAMRWGVGAGATRVASGTMTLHRRLEERLARFTGSEATLLFGSGLAGQPRRDPGARAPRGDRVPRRAEPSVGASTAAGWRAPRRSHTDTATPSTWPGRCGSPTAAAR